MVGQTTKAKADALSRYQVAGRVAAGFRERGGVALQRRGAGVPLGLGRGQGRFRKEGGRRGDA